MFKILKLEIRCCACCPYCRYNADYGMSYDAGYDCDHNDAPNNARIADEGGYKSKNPGSKIIENRIPDWCPLPNEGESNV